MTFFRTEAVLLLRLARLNELPERGGQTIQHRAAGVIPYRRTAVGVVELLLAKLRKEGDEKKRQWDNTYATLSGSRAKPGAPTYIMELSNPVATAAREAVEETDGLLGSVSDVMSLIVAGAEETRVLKNNGWNPPPEADGTRRDAFPVPTYVFAVPEGLSDLDARFNASPERVKQEGEIRALDWVPLPAILAALEGQTPKDLKNLPLPDGKVLADYAARTILVNRSDFEALLQ